ncbi:MAG: type II toxin-antitoxin system VapC family toxin [Propionibacteriaceae bacterium]|nr:type II toxin-antitoxin system VapC family toxin [Propionibacteriaceae bacterium]
MYLLDTNVVSELRKPTPHGGVLAWIAGQPDANLHICALTVGEIQIGVERTRRQDPAKADEIEAWLDQVIRTHDVLAVDADTYRIWGKLITGRSDTLYEDALIAACALRHGLTVATRNIKHFRLLDVPVVDPFAALS